MSEDILKTDFDWDGQDVYIVGSGANAKRRLRDGKVYIHSVPESAILIVANKAIKMGWIFPDYWLCATPALAQLAWFKKAMKGNTIPIIARYGTLIETYPTIPYYFHPGASLWADAERDAAANIVKSVTKYYGCTTGYLRGGASAVARGVQLAWFKKAKRCILIGADMKGREYFDGTINESKQSTIDNKGHWYELPFFNELIAWVKDRDMDVVSLTPTALNVEVIDAV